MTALLILFLTALVVLFAGLAKGKKMLVTLTMLGVGAALFFTLGKMNLLFSESWAGAYESMLKFDGFADAFTVSVLVSTLLLLGLAGFGFRQLEETLGDHLGLILFSLCGALCLFSFNNVVMLFLGIEILSIPLYVLAGSRRNDLSGNEAALKYFLLGAFSTGIFLFGTALIYGATGSFDLTAIAKAITAAPESPVLLKAGIAMIAIGLCFKVSAAPFHFWAPDVYEGSPSLITAFMSTVVKTAAIAAFFRLFSTALLPAMPVWDLALAGVCALTMTVANVTAIFQQSFKRMMAWSSISHAGYLLLGVLAADVVGTGGAIFFYSLAYSVATICAFAIYILVSEQQNDSTFTAFNGLGKRQPMLAAGMAIAMLSLAGIPPLSGFFGKYFLFTAAFPKYPWLVLLAVVNSAISIFYYFRVISAMYFSTGDEPVIRLEVPRAYRLVLWAGLILTVALAVWPGGVYRLF